ncbi:Rieske 2Fe-2S domain-containing protein [Aureivirga sp. CE67]|uniref:Rieske 2Fe-2S domain-containing protein n=1 Tax=Aureivirga sp. CE67 TaxID=1788983 RepID=UPI0018C9A997|nr:Rieske 2Fe-2S domain-containing protein [Aureivirga sp. CE67]
MGLNYQLVLWNKNKKVYDRFILLFVLLYLLLFWGITLITNSNTSLETLTIRSSGTLAILLLHIILSIGPLARINKKFLPLLYNRRHLGVSMFLIALIHGGFSIFQFHMLGDVNPIYSVFTSNLDYSSLHDFPFQVLGFLALLILFAMAATSHDFWLANLSAKTWKTLHMLVYVAYALIVSHVFLGAFQQETSPYMPVLMGIGFVVLVILHISAGIKEVKKDKQTYEASDEDWKYVCEIDEIEEDRAKIFIVDHERIAIFKYENKLSAIHNVCKHQGGPLGEGKIIDGCITCPWHGYQYLPQNGQSPPPFTEKVATYYVKIEDKKVYVLPKPLDEGTEVSPAIIES